MVILAYLWGKNNCVVISTQVAILRIISGQVAILQHLLRCSFQELIKRVEIVISSLLMNYSGFLQKVIVDVASHGVPFKVKVDIHVLAKSRRVVVAVGFSVAKGFQNVIGLQQNILGPLNFFLAGHICYCCYVPKTKIISWNISQEKKFLEFALKNNENQHGK